MKYIMYIISFASFAFSLICRIIYNISESLPNPLAKIGYFIINNNTIGDWWIILILGTGSCLLISLILWIINNDNYGVLALISGCSLIASILCILTI